MSSAGKKIRRGKNGIPLRKHEYYRADQDSFRYKYKNSLGVWKEIKAPDIQTLRKREETIKAYKADGLRDYVTGDATINYVFDRYIAMKTELKGRTRTQYLITYDKYVRKYFGKKKIRDVMFSEVMEFYIELLKKLALGTVEGVHSVLHPTFQLAVRDRVIRNNPADGAMSEARKKLSATAGIRHALSFEETRAFLDYSKRPEYKRWHCLYTTMFGTGMRVGEVIGLRWDDVDFENNVISVNHSTSYYQKCDEDFKCGYEITTPKTEAGIRTIPMLEEVREALLEEREYQDKVSGHCLFEIDGYTDFIFSNRMGKIHLPSGINRQIHRMVANYNAEEEVRAARENRKPVIIPQFSCHVTRHTYCSRLCENGVNVAAIQNVMGHRDAQTTLNIYTEISEQKKQAMFTELNGKNVL